MTKFRKFINVFATVVLVLATLLVVFVFAQRLTGKTPKVLGYQLFNVVTDSMEPKLKVGDVILVKKCNPEEDIKKGDIISYHGKVGDFAGKDVTHMVVKDPVKNADGTLTLQTQGLKLGAVLDPQIKGEQVIGKYVMKLHIMSFIYALFKKWYGLVVFILILILLMGREVINLHKLSDKGKEECDENEEDADKIIQMAKEKLEAQKKEKECSDEEEKEVKTENK